MPLLDSITIKGFKSIASVEKLALRPINLLIGANGSGKSNFLEVFQFLRAVTSDRLAHYVEDSGGANRLLHFGAKKTAELLFELRNSASSPPLEFTFRFGLARGDQLGSLPSDSIPVLKLEERQLRIFDHRLRDSSETGTDDYRVSSLLYQPLIDALQVCQFHDTSKSSPLKSINKIEDNRSLRPDGSNLAAFLHLLRERHRSSYDEIRDTVRRVAPFFDDFNLSPRALNPDTILLEWKHRGSDGYWNASDFSDGTLRFTALITLLLQPKELRPAVILIDEPELGLHPFAIQLLGGIMRSVSVHSQIIAATQSPQLVDCFEPQDILVAERVDGATQFIRPDAERLKAWLEDYSLGELWQKNEIGGQPVPEQAA